MRKTAFLSAALATLSLWAGENLLKNPGFEKLDKKGAPAAWRISQPKEMQGKAGVVTQNAASGKQAFQFDIAASAPKKQATVWQYVRLAKPFPKGTIKVSFKISCENVENASAILRAGSERGKMELWKNVGIFRKSSPWKTVTAEYDLPCSVGWLDFAIRMNGTGSVWLDDVCVELIPPDPNAGKTEVITFDNPKKNAEGLPDPWLGKHYVGNENVSSVSIVQEEGKNVALQHYRAGAMRDGFHAPVASYWVKEKAVRLSVPVRTTGKGSVETGFAFYDGAGNILGEVLSKAKAFPGKGGTSAADFAVPAGAVSAKVLLLNTGAGDAFFGSATISRGSAEKALKLELPVITARVYPVIHSKEQQEVDRFEFNTFADSPTKLTFHFLGENRKLKKPALCLDLPAHLKIIDAVYPHPNATHLSEKFTSKELKRPEGAYRRWRFEAPQGMKNAGRTQLFQRRLVTLIMPEKAGETSSGNKVFWHIENAGKALPEQSFLVNVLPPLPKTPNPKNFVFYRWNDEDFTWSNDEVQLLTMRCQEEAGYTVVSSRDTATPVRARMRAVRDLAAKRGWKVFIRGAVSSAMRYYNGMNVRQAEELSGKHQHKKLCPEFLLNDPEFKPVRDAMIRKDIQSRITPYTSTVILDFEDWHPMDYCFCTACRTRFAELNSITPVPDAQTIRSKYPVQWRDFRVAHGVGQIKMIYDVCKEYGLKLGDYNYVTDYSKPDYRNRYFSVAKDALANEKYQHLHAPSYYHYHDAEAFDMMRVGLDHLKQPYYPLCAVDGICSYQSAKEVLTPARFRMMMLSAAVNGCPGFGIYPGERVDGKFYVAFDKAMAEIACFEDLMRHGKVTDAVQVKPLPLREFKITSGGKELTMQEPRWNKLFRSRVVELNGKRLISLLNYSTDKSCFVRLTAKNGKFSPVQKYTDGKLVPYGSQVQELIVEVAPRDAVFLQEDLKAEAAPMSQEQQSLQEQLEKKFQDAVKETQKKNALIPPEKSGEFSFSYTDANGDGAPDAVLANAKQSVTIDLANAARVIRWQIAGNELLPKPGCSLAETNIWQPRPVLSNGINCKLLSVKMDRKCACLTAEYRVPGLPLLVEKSFRLEPGSQTLSVSTRYTNTGKADQEFSLWGRNLIAPGSPANALIGNDLWVCDRGKSVKVPRHRTGVLIKLPSAAKNSGVTRDFDLSVTADNAVIEQRYAKPELTITYRPDPEQTVFFSLYNSNGAGTVEWNSRKQNLAPGASLSVSDLWSVR